MKVKIQFVKIHVFVSERWRKEALSTGMVFTMTWVLKPKQPYSNIIHTAAVPSNRQ